MSGVLFDARWITPDMTGVGRVALEILRGIPRGERPQVGIILPESHAANPEFDGFRIFASRIGITRHPLTEFYEQFVIPFLCSRHGYDAFVSFEGRLPVWHVGFKTYGYIHDAVFLSRRRSHGLKYTTFLRMHLAAMRAFATGIITVSEAAKARLAGIAGLRPERITVIHNADSGLGRVAPVPSGAASRRPYILAVGMSNPRKNFPVLARAFATFNANRAFHLVVTGDFDVLEKLREQAGVPGILNAGFVTDGALRHLYENATCLVYPSLEEGFGIPLLDAGLLGTPVACSDLDVFHEVLEDGAAYFDPEDAESIARALKRAIGGEAPAPDPVRLRHRFSWERSATTLLSLVRTGRNDGRTREP